METGDYRGTVVDKLPHLLSTKNSRRCLPPDFLLSSAVVRSPRCIFSWRDAAQRCGRHDKNDPLFGGFSSLRSLKIGIFPGRKKVSQGKPTEKWVIFIIDSSAMLKRDVKKTSSLFNVLLSVPTVGAAAFRLAQDIDYHGARRCQAKLCGARCGDGCGIA